MKVGLEFPCFGGVDPAGGDTIREGSLEKRVETGKFVIVDGDYELARSPMGDAMLLGKFKRGTIPGRAHPSFEGARGVVGASVNYSRIAAGLMGRPARLFLQHCDVVAESCGKFCNSKADNPASDDYNPGHAFSFVIRAIGIRTEAQASVRLVGVWPTTVNHE
jgi:hypothetical protein